MGDPLGACPSGKGRFLSWPLSPVPGTAGWLLKGPKLSGRAWGQGDPGDPLPAQGIPFILHPTRPLLLVINPVGL